VFAGIVGGAGAAMVILAIATGVRAVTAETGADVAGTGAAFIAVFGLLALGAAAWLWVRADRSQGS
jgi:predicted amino acid dehydrogenase